MRILKLSASFGGLQNAELTLNEGLNVITAPNESGKSTWAAFLMAMLYGVDSSERTTKTNLPVKTKFKPWSGAPMEGRMELEWQGKRITIERSTKGRVPMGEFRAYETASGQAVAGMTGENCGELLLGVSRSVFERSAFIGQGAMALTSDAELEKRLSSLVTAGDETVSFSDTQKTLRDWRNRCRHNRTGLLPQTLMELQETENTLEQIRRLHRSDMELTARREAYLAQQEKLQTLVAALKAREANRALEKKTAAEQALKEAENARRQAEQAASALPERETLQELEKQLALLEAEARRLPAEAEEAPVPPECPAAFRGLPEEEIVAAAQKDAQEAERLSQGKRRSSYPALALLALALALQAAVFLIEGGTLRLVLRLVLAALAAGALIWMLLLRRKNRELDAQLARAQELLQKYGVKTYGELVPLAAEYCAQLRLYAQKTKQHETRCMELEEERRRVAEQKARLLGQVSMLSPEAAADTEAAHRAIAAALALLDALEKARQEENAAKSRYEAVCAALSGVRPVQAPEMDLTGYELGSVSNELLRLNSSLADVRSQLDQSRGRVAALGDPAELEAKREALTARAEALTKRYGALELALGALENANSELQTRFSPQISALAGRLLGEMTGERYDTILLGSDLRAEAREKGELVTRQLLYLSGGTADQVYLAVRLAICKLALGEDVPIVLDDALVRFDDERMRAALTLLRQEAGTRQIILFSCQKREQAALKQIQAAERQN